MGRRQRFPKYESYSNFLVYVSIRITNSTRNENITVLFCTRLYFFLRAAREGRGRSREEDGERERRGVLSAPKRDGDRCRALGPGHGRAPGRGNRRQGKTVHDESARTEMHPDRVKCMAFRVSVFNMVLVPILFLHRARCVCGTRAARQRRGADHCRRAASRPRGHPGCCVSDQK